MVQRKSFVKGRAKPLKRRRVSGQFVARSDKPRNAGFSAKPARQSTKSKSKADKSPRSASSSRVRKKRRVEPARASAPEPAKEPELDPRTARTSRLAARAATVDAESSAFRPTTLAEFAPDKLPPSASDNIYSVLAAKLAAAKDKAGRLNQRQRRKQHAVARSTFRSTVLKARVFSKPGRRSGSFGPIVGSLRWIQQTFAVGKSTVQRWSIRRVSFSARVSTLSSSLFSAFEISKIILSLCVILLR